MIDQKIVRAEAYKKLKLLKRQFSNLPHHDFPCEGADHVWRLISTIIERLFRRFNKYSHRQMQQLNSSLFPSLEQFCGFLDDSRTDKVPWSIIPSLEDLFSRIKPDTRFVISPLWETNYRIVNRNIIEFFDSRVISIPNLLFDPSPNFDDERKKFLKEFPAAIYFIFYPRTERLSVLHFPLLGHEIGHIHSSDWLKSDYEKMLKKYEIKKKLKEHLNQQIPTQFYGPLFRDRAINIRVAEIDRIYKRVMSELLSDLFGVFIFGHAAMLSSYIFSLKFGFDDFNGVENGYLPWRFRLHFLLRAMSRLGLEWFDEGYPAAQEWIKRIRQIGSVSIEGYDYSQTNVEYIGFLVDAFNKDFNQILDNIVLSYRDEAFLKNYSQKLESAVYERLGWGIIPNCTIDSDLNEVPIGLRNIVGGTWLYLCEQKPDDYEKFQKVSRSTNLLSLKGIELSYFQKEFNYDADKKRNRTAPESL